MQYEIEVNTEILQTAVFGVTADDEAQAKAGQTVKADAAQADADQPDPDDMRAARHRTGRPGTEQTTKQNLWF
jgi:hypothetical protein